MSPAFPDTPWSLSSSSHSSGTYFMTWGPGRGGPRGSATASRQLPMVLSRLKWWPTVWTSHAFCVPYVWASLSCPSGLQNPNQTWWPSPGPCRPGGGSPRLSCDLDCAVTRVKRSRFGLLWPDPAVVVTFARPPGERASQARSQSPMLCFLGLANHTG